VPQRCWDAEGSAPGSVKKSPPATLSYRIITESSAPRHSRGAPCSARRHTVGSWLAQSGESEATTRSSSVPAKQK
jgi:hypothetical protein